MTTERKGDLIHEDETKEHIKEDKTPAGHLKHLLNIGWLPESFLIRRFVRNNNLEKELQEYVRQ